VGALGLISGLLIPVVLICALIVSSSRGGPGIGLGAPVFEVHKVPEEDKEAPFSWGSDQPVFVLVMGNDARPGQTSQARGDALHLVGVNPGTGQATILNIPRDTWTNVPGVGTDKINVGNYYGGPVLQAKAVGQLVGVDVPYVISTDFDGFQAMVDELGGVDIDVPYPMDDANSGAHFEPGVTHMLGGEALAFSRDRHLEGGDLTRSYNQSLVVIAALAKLRGVGVSATTALHWLSVLMRHGTFDGVDAKDLYRLGRLALSIDPANVRSVTMPGTLGYVGQQSVVFKGPGADSLFEDFRDDAVLQAN
jgi:LCP family protein required for cell wall assembly